MSISPDFDAFAACYEAGKPQLVSTTLVADLETPVSAYLKLADGRANSFLLESVEGGSVRGRYSIIGFKPDVIWRCTKGQAEINRRARTDLHAFEPLEGRPLETLRLLIRECQMELPPGLPPMASGLFGFLGYDMVRDMEQLPDKNPDPIGLPDAIMVRPTLICIFDRLEDNVTLVTPAWPQAGIGARAAYEAAQERLADAVSDFERSLPFRRESADALDGLPEPQANMTEGRIQGDGRDLQGVHPRGRRLPDRSLAALLRAVQAAAAVALPVAAAHQPLAVPDLLRLRRFLDRGLQPRDPGAPARQHRHHPAARRHHPARRHARGGQAARRQAAGRSQGARRAPDAARSRAQRRRPRRQDRLGARSSSSSPSRSTATSSTSAAMSRARSRTGWTRSTRSRPASRPARCRARPRCAPWRSSTRSSRCAAASMPAAPATSPPTARWTPASCCAPAW